MFVVVNNAESIEYKNQNQAIDTIWSRKDPPGFYYEVVDHVIGMSCKSHTLFCRTSRKHVDSDVSVITQFGMIVSLLLIRLLCTTTIN